MSLRVEPDSKICNKCFLPKPIAEFSLRSDGKGHRSTCKACRASQTPSPSQEVISIETKINLSGEWPENAKLTQQQNDYCVSRFKLLFDTSDQQGRNWMLGRWGVSHDTFKARAREADLRLSDVNGKDLRPMDCWSPLPKDIHRVIVRKQVGEIE